MSDRARAILGIARVLVSAVVLSAVGSELAADFASAHVGHVIQRGERYLKLDATQEDTRLVVSLMLGPEEGERVLAAADADGDRRVTPAEADAYLGQWGAGLREELPVRVDGRAAELAWRDGWLEPIGRVRPVPLTVELVAHLPSESRELAVVFEDRMVRRETFDRTDVAFRAHDGAELVACGAEPEPVGCEAPDVALIRGRPQPTTFAARLRYPGRAAARPWWLVGVAGALVVAAVVGVRRMRARRALTSR